MKRIRRQDLMHLNAAGCSQEECVAGIGGDGTVYLTHLAFNVEDEQGNVIGVLSCSSMPVPLSHMTWTPGAQR